MSYKKLQPGLLVLWRVRKNYFFQRPDRQCQQNSALGDNYADRAAIVKAEEVTTGTRMRRLEQKN